LLREIRVGWRLERLSEAQPHSACHCFPIKALRGPMGAQLQVRWVDTPSLAIGEVLQVRVRSEVQLAKR